MTILVLWNIHNKDAKLIGHFSTQEKLDAAKTELLKQPGFKDNTDGFVVDEYKLDEVGWKEGYVVAEDECDDFELTIRELEEFLTKHHRFNSLRLGRCENKWFARLGSFLEGTDKDNLTAAIKALMEKLEAKR